MPVREYEPEFRSDFPPEPIPLWEAEENLRVIRDLMERSTRYSTFSGLSGVFAGTVSVIGCVVQKLFVQNLPPGSRAAAFLVNWTAVIALAIGADYLLTKRRAARVGKTIRSRLGKQMLLASVPGLGAGALLTLFLLRNGLMEQVYPFWMLSYGIAVCAVGLFSQKEVSRLGWAFLGAGAATFLACSVPALAAHASGIGLLMTALSFGGFHILYGISAARRGGW